MIILGELIKIRGSDNYSDTGGTGLGSYRNALLALHPTGRRMERYCAYVRLLASDGDA